MATMRVLVVGSGGREHALAWRLARDPEVVEVLVAPGNDGAGREFRRLATVEPEPAALVAACRAEHVDLAVIGPEAPLAAGVVDALTGAGILAYGPAAAAARLESSKWFAKQVMLEAGVPTARAERFEALDPARAALARFGPPWVIKADGLAAGKGVRVTADRTEASDFLAACLVDGRFGASGRAVVLEEFLEGEEVSVMAVCDGRRFTLLPAARDYKRALEGDRGPNTGGMGAFAPSPAGGKALLEETGSRVVGPVLAAMAGRGAPFRGTLYAGLMLTPHGPRVLEFNGRFGDPETEVVMPLLDGSLARLLASAARGTLEPAAVRAKAGAAVAVALVDEGYPDVVRGEGVLEGLEELPARHGVLVFHAGTAREAGRWRVRGGRAAYVVAPGATRAAARARAYQAIADVKGQGWRCRSDIALDVAATAGAVSGGGHPTQEG